MSVRKFFYSLIGLEVIVLAVLVLLSLRGTSSIGLCRYDMTHPFGYITPADAQIMKVFHSNMANKCPRGIFTASYYTIYLLLITTGAYLVILLKRLFTRSKPKTGVQE